MVWPGNPKPNCFPDRVALRGEIRSFPEHSDDLFRGESFLQGIASDLGDVFQESIHHCIDEFFIQYMGIYLYDLYFVGKSRNCICEARICIGVIQGTTHTVIHREPLQGYHHGYWPLALAQFFTYFSSYLAELRMA